MSIILELQAQALDSSVPIGDLLLKALLVATKLDLDEFRAWVECELYGYKTGKVPEYRVIPGRPTIEDGLGRTKTLIHNDPEVNRLWARLLYSNPIAEVDSHFRGEDGFVRLAFPPNLQDSVMREFGGVDGYWNVSIKGFGNILQRVRAEILTWTLKLEKDGIKGDSLTFNENEKAIAQSKREELGPNTTIINIGTMTNSSIQAASPDGNVKHSRNVT
jgi:hypothetical protein